jgi:L-fuconolactonase
MIIDTHQHFWKYSPQKHQWINGEMSALKKDFLPEDLQKIYKEHGIKGCVAVQAEQSEEETGFLLQLADRYKFIRGVVGWVDLKSENLGTRLDYYKNFDKLKGFRHIVQDEPDPDFLLDQAFQRGLGQLEKNGFTYDLLIYPRHMNAAIHSVRNFPNLRFVIDHIAKPDIRNSKINDWARSMETIAHEKNVYCKMSGMVTEASWRGWKQSDFVPYLDVVFQTFGADRVMFGSDWPVCLLAGGFQDVLDIIVQYTRGFSEQDKQKIYYTNAMDFYRLSLSQQKWGNSS